MGHNLQLAFSTMKTVTVEMGRAVTPRTARRSMQAERSHTVGDKGGKKGKQKTEKQKAAKQEVQTQKKEEKQKKSTP